MPPIKRPNIDSPSRSVPVRLRCSPSFPPRPSPTLHTTGSSPSALTDTSLLVVHSSAAASDLGKRVKFAPDSSSAAGSSSRPGGGASRPGADDDDEDDLEEGSGRKNTVIEAGYDSDSSAGSDGGFGIGGGRQGKNKTQADDDEGAEEDEDDDMFGTAEEKEDDDKPGAKGKGKGKEFLELGDIEGQEFAEGGGEVDADEEEYVPEDDLANTDDAPRGKRSKEGMGYTLR